MASLQTQTKSIFQRLYKDTENTKSFQIQSILCDSVQFPSQFTSTKNTQFQDFLVIRANKVNQESNCSSVKSQTKRTPQPPRAFVQWINDHPAFFDLRHCVGGVLQLWSLEMSNCLIWWTPENNEMICPICLPNGDTCDLKQCTTP